MGAADGPAAGICAQVVHPPRNPAADHGARPRSVVRRRHRRPVAIRFTTTRAQRGVLLDPELRLGEAYMDGTMRIEQGSIADFLELVLGAGTAACRRAGRACNGWLRYLYRRLAQFNPPVRAHAQRRASLRSRRPALFAVPRRRPAILLRLFRATRPVARRRAAREEAAHRREAPDRSRASACSTSAPAGAGSGSISRRSAGAHVTGVTLSRRAARSSRTSARDETDLDGAVEFRLQDYRDVAGAIRPHRLGRHVRACRRRPTTTSSSASAPSCSPTTA